jgi:hypothetical protein
MKPHKADDPYASSLDRRLQRMGAKNLQDRIAHGIGPDSRIHFPTTITPVSEKPMTIPWLALPFLTIESCDYSTHQPLKHMIIH